MADDGHVRLSFEACPRLHSITPLIICQSGLRNLGFPRRRYQWKDCIGLRASVLSFLLVVLSDRIHNPSKEPDRYGGHRSKCNWVTKEDHTRGRNRQLIQGTNHTDLR